MRVRWAYLALGLVFITGKPVLAQSDKSAAKSAVSDRNPKLAESRKKDESSSGEQKFQQNCSRCHNAPESFPPHISGTIVKHMRVRASLSEEDAREILRYLNPQ
jgi:mono/diheme cytochrome c family protein